MPSHFSKHNFDSKTTSTDEHVFVWLTAGCVVDQIVVHHATEEPQEEAQWFYIEMIS